MNCNPVQKESLIDPSVQQLSVDGTKVIENISLELPDQTVTWENPLKNYPLSEGQIAVADELLSIRYGCA